MTDDITKERAKELRESDELLVDVLVDSEPRIIPGEDAAYKRAVIRMTLEAVYKLEETLDEIESIGQRREDDQ